MPRPRCGSCSSPATEPSYLLHWLPGLMLSGASVGLVLPSLSGAAVSRLPAQHYAVGSAVNQATRQIGSVIGVAITVLLLGHGTVAAQRLRCGLRAAHRLGAADRRLVRNGRHPTGKSSGMKAFIVDRYGKQSGRLGEMPEPQLLDDDVLVQVHAAGVNPLDAKIRNGEFKLVLPYRLPLILGNEVAGVVLRVGSRVQRFKPGDEVYARPDKNRIGTFAELIAINQPMSPSSRKRSAWNKQPRSRSLR